MASLADLFNPSFFVILGIVALLIALVVVYFESKIREQNHKIASMLSLVSTLAEDMNGVKMGLNHLAITSATGGGKHAVSQSISQNISQDLGLFEEEDNSPHLIEVSDDEDEDYEDEDDYDEEESVKQTDNDDSEDETEEDTEESDEDEPVKVIKLNISENVEESEHSYEETNKFDEDDLDDLDVLEDIGDIPEISEEYTEEMLSLKYDEVKEDQAQSNTLLEAMDVPSASELKTISINLGEDSQSEHIEYKKLQLPKLRSITVEKGLTTNLDAQKLKKQELLKLLGVE